MGDLLYFPGVIKPPVNPPIVKKKAEPSFFFDREKRVELEERVLSVLSHGKLMFISTILNTLKDVEQSKIFVTMGKLQRKGIIEQLEVQGEKQRIKGYFRLKGQK